jgi:hypothetical protein
VPSREAQKKEEELRSDGVGSGLNTQARRAKNTTDLEGAATEKRRGAENCWWSKWLERFS